MDRHTELCKYIQNNITLEKWRLSVGMFILHTRHCDV